MRQYAIAVLALGVMSAAPAQALTISGSGGRAVLSGIINIGDDLIVRDFLKSAAGSGVRVLYLNSPGGKVAEAHRIARLVRGAGIRTVVDASRAICESACTGIFAGGVSRHYINAGSVQDGLGGARRGLAFHEGNSAASGRRTYSGPATAGMINTYYEMGVPGAARLISNAPYNDLFRVSAQTALSHGIATSLSPP